MTRPVFSRRAGASRGLFAAGPWECRRSCGRCKLASEPSCSSRDREAGRTWEGLRGTMAALGPAQGGRRPLGRTHVGAGAWRLTPGDIRDRGPFGRTLPEGEPHRPRVALRHCSRPRGSLEGWHLLELRHPVTHPRPRHRGGEPRSGRHSNGRGQATMPEGALSFARPPLVRPRWRKAKRIPNADALRSLLASREMGVSK